MSDLDLKLPIIKGDVMPPPVLSMDEYLEFVQWNWEHLVDQEASEYWAKVFRVDVPFTLKD